MSRHRTSSQMYPLVEEWQSGTMTQKQFCQSKDISSSVFSYWVKRYTNQVTTQPTGFTEILPEHSASIEIHYPNGVQVSLPLSAHNPAILRSLIQLH